MCGVLAALPFEEVRAGLPDGDNEAPRIVGVTSLLRANGSKAPVRGSRVVLGLNFECSIVELVLFCFLDDGADFVPGSEGTGSI